jgi:undecaprenyl-diphosphatase
MNTVQIIVLAIIQGLAELLPVSSSAHVVVAEKLMGLDPSSPSMTFLLVMLHTGTMFAVIAYFWKAWKKSFFSSSEVFKKQIVRLIVATLLTGVVGYPLMKGIELGANKLGYVARDENGQLVKAEIENLFGNLELISGALIVVGIFIIVAGLSKQANGQKEVGMREAGWMGAVQGLCLPFRGFSRSGATISTGLLLGATKARVEEFSFALAVIITPAVIGREALRLLKHNDAATTQPLDLPTLFLPGILGMIFSFIAGLVALVFLSKVLEKGRWHLFGFYCILAGLGVFVLYLSGK